MKKLLDKLWGRSGRGTHSTTQNYKGTLYQDGFFETEKTIWLNERFFSYLVNEPEPVKVEGVRIPPAIKNEINLFLNQHKSSQIVLPRQPKLLPKLIHAINNPKSGAQTILSLVSSDPNLVAEVIRQSNSAFYKTDKGNVTSLKRAVDLLGHNGLRRAATNIALAPILNIEQNVIPTFGTRSWEFSTHVAVAAEELARLKSTGSEKAYLLGLMASLGDIVLYQLFAKFVGSSKKGLDDQTTILHKLIYFYRWRITLKIFEQWEMPENMMRAVIEQEQRTHPSKMSVYGNILYQAQLSTMAYTMMSHSKIPNDKGKLILLVQGLLKSQILNVFDQLKALDKALVHE